MSRRKPSLRIGGGVLNRNTLFEKDETDKPKGQGGLGSYNDDGNLVHSQIFSEEKKENHGSTNLDSKVADFLKEIDELDSPLNKVPSEISAEVSWGDWQQCIDDTTQHPYYWNTATNKVTWVLPEEIAKQLQSAQAVSKHEEKNPNNSESTVGDGTGSSKSVPAKLVEDTDSKTNEHSASSGNDNMDLDVEAELDQALSTKPEYASSILDLELELLRTGLLPISSEEREELYESLEEEILRLEVAEEEKRKSGSWSQYKEEIDLMNKEIYANKAKWKNERFPMLMNINSTKHVKEKDKSSETNPASNSEVGLPKTKETTEMSSKGSRKIKTDNEVTSDECSLERTNHTSMSELKISLPLPKEISELKKDSDDIEKDISATSKVILDKLAYLEISRTNISDFHVLLIELGVRLTDWEKKVLPSSYFRTKLQEAVERLKNYEENATPQGWSCHWDSSVKRYFYKNNKTQETQWQYPIMTALQQNDRQVKDLTGVDESSIIAHETEGNTKKRKVLTTKDSTFIKKSRSESPMSGVHDRIISSAGESNNENSTKTDSKEGSDEQKYPCTNQNVNYAYLGYQQNYPGYAGYQLYRAGQSNAMMTSTQNLRGGSPQLTTSTGVPTPPPPGEELGENENSDAPPPLPTGPDEPPPPLPPVPPEEESENECDEDGGVMMEMSDGEIDDEETSTIVTQVPTAVMSQQPIIYKPTEVMQAYYTQQTTTDMYYTIPTASIDSKSQSKAKNYSQPVSASLASQVVDSANQMLKKKKIKKTKKSTQAKRPPKEMSSMVAQWQKAKQQIEEEDRILEEEEEVVDNKELSRRQVEKWKEQQIMSGKAHKNVNFTPIPKNWRERLIKKKNKS